MTVLRSGRPWLRIASTDRVDRGILTAQLDGLRRAADSRILTYRYDPVTGVLR